MPRCPYCKNEIDHLINTCDDIQQYIFRIVGDQVVYEYLKSLGGTFSEYECPICGSTLFDDDDEAEKFLRGILDLPEEMGDE